MSDRFMAGDRVAWSHRLGAVFGDNVTMKESAIRSHDPHAVFGIVVGSENEVGTYFRVKFDADEVARVAAIESPTHVVPDDGEHVLTFEELVKVAS